MLCKEKFAACSEIYTEAHKRNVLTVENSSILNLVVRKETVGL
jgi:hypothetical protein